MNTKDKYFFKRLEEQETHTVIRGIYVRHTEITPLTQLWGGEVTLLQHLM